MTMKHGKLTFLLIKEICPYNLLVVLSTRARFLGWLMTITTTVIVSPQNWHCNMIFYLSVCTCICSLFSLKKRRVVGIGLFLFHPVISFKMQLLNNYATKEIFLDPSPHSHVFLSFLILYTQKFIYTRTQRAGFL